MSTKEDFSLLDVADRKEIEFNDGKYFNDFLKEEERNDFVVVYASTRKW